MTEFFWPVIIASLIAFALKFAGFLVPRAILEHDLFKKIIPILPIGMLSGLIAVQVLAEKQTIVFDGRLIGVAVGIVALIMRAPFIVVVVLAAFVTALGRAKGLWI
jgi:hypothetical protein